MLPPLKMTLTTFKHGTEQNGEWLSINPTKCELLRVINKRNTMHSPIIPFMTLNSTVDNTNYLGITINSKLSWKPRVNSMSKKANSTRGLLCRQMQSCPRKMEEQAYIYLYVRPILEYALSCWIHSPKNKIEMVQRRAARFVMSDDSHARYSVTQMLQTLG